MPAFPLRRNRARHPARQPGALARWPGVLRPARPAAPVAFRARRAAGRAAPWAVFGAGLFIVLITLCVMGASGAHPNALVFFLPVVATGAVFMLLGYRGLHAVRAEAERERVHLIELAILQAGHAHDGALTPAQLAVYLGLGLADARLLLDLFEQDGGCVGTLREDGEVLYAIRGLR